jgi:Ca2+-binding RTX toxin-like protein
MAVREGGPGNDRLIGTAARDFMEGKGGNDVLFGLAGNDVMDGDAGNDVLYGGLGDDLIDGGDGLDRLFGQAGNDILDGGAGNDIMAGGAGNDTYIFDSRDGHDRIMDFTAGGTQDRLNLVDAAFNFRNLADVLNRATDVGGNCVIQLGGGDSVTLVGVQESQLTAADFIF